ncbi:MAG: hypothetical protein U0X73_10135 [Thermoanaerobaculia bacterium]
MRAPTFALALALVAALSPARPVAAAIGLDLSYVDTGSPAFQRFLGFVDDAVAGNPGYGFSATDAATAGRLVPADPDYCALAVSMADQQVIDAETAWSTNPPERPEIAFDSYLYSGPMLRDLALAYDWCAAAVSASQRSRWENYAEQAVFNIWNPSAASWNGHSFPWSGWSIDNPGNNYHFSFLAATMYWGFASQGCATCDDWIGFLAAEKIPPLVAYYQGLPGGGSREGTGYGVAQKGLFELYRLWRDSTPAHQDLAAASTHLRDTIDYWIHATVPTRDRFAPIGDQARVSIPDLYDYHRALVLQARAMTAGSEPVNRRATWWLDHVSVPEMQSGFNFRDDLLPAGSVENPPSALFYSATGVGHHFARSSWATDALWLAAVAGRYDESHAHQDQGGFTLFQGTWLAVTENIWTHSGIEQGTEVHNVVRFDQGASTIAQHDATSPVSTADDGRFVSIAADLTNVYSGSAVASWTRTLRFDRQGSLLIADRFAKSAGVTATFQVQVPVAPVVAGRTATAGALHLRVLLPNDATLSVLDWHAVDPTEFNSGFRIDAGGSGGEFLVELTVGAFPGDALFADNFETGAPDAWSGHSP